MAVGADAFRDRVDSSTWAAGHRAHNSGTRIFPSTAAPSLTRTEPWRDGRRAGPSVCRATRGVIPLAEVRHALLRPLSAGEASDGASGELWPTPGRGATARTDTPTGAAVNLAKSMDILVAGGAVPYGSGNIHGRRFTSPIPRHLELLAPSPP